MTTCRFNAELVCENCGYKARKPRTIRTCDSAAPEPAAPIGMIRQAASYATALARWITAGRPTRTQTQIDAILAEHCVPCEHFTGSACKLCGCRINRDPAAWQNKLAMGTEPCPMEPPKWPADF